jgi:hypothetical protein
MLSFVFGKCQLRNTVERLPMLNYILHRHPFFVCGSIGILAGFVNAIIA